MHEMIGKEYAYRLAETKLGDDANRWLRERNDDLEDGVAPVGLLESGCPACINQVAMLLEAM